MRPSFFCALLLALAHARAADTIQIASLSTITTEIAETVGGDRVNVIGLVKPGVDPHSYEPTPDDLKQVEKSRLVLATGKHMEGYLTKLKESAGAKGDLLQVGDEFPSLHMKAEEGETTGSTNGMVEDPHWWHSVENMELATKIVAAELKKIDTADKDYFTKNENGYLGQLDELKQWIRLKVAELPRDKRKLVTSHDAFQYFARDYGFTIYGIEGVSTEDEPSNKKVSEIIDTIKSQQVKAIFFESIENPKVSTAITHESGAKIGGTLYSDGLGEGSAATYDGMMRHNVTTIVDSLK